MINPMTFNSFGSDENLTWSRDEASVRDVLLSARTTDSLFKNGSDGWAYNIRRGVEPLYFTDFRASITRKSGGIGTVFINLARGYIAGRYFEITDESWGTVSTFTNGWTLLTLSATGYNLDTATFGNIRPTLLTSSNVVRDDINMVTRKPSERTISYTTNGAGSKFYDYYSGVISTKFLVVWDKTIKTNQTTSLEITQVNSSLVNGGESTSDPYYYSPNGVNYYVNTDVTGILDKTLHVPITFQRFGDKHYGSWTFSGGFDNTVDLSGYIKQPTDFHTPKDITNSKLYTEYAFRSIMLRTQSDSNMAYVRSGYFGINGTGVGSNWDPTWSEMLTVMSDQGMGSFTSGGVGYTTMLKTRRPFTSSIITGVFEDRNDSWSAFSFTNNRNTGRSTFPVDTAPKITSDSGNRYRLDVFNNIRMSNVTVSINSVKYLTHTQVENGAAGNGVLIRSGSGHFTQKDPSYVAVSCSVSTSAPMTISFNGKTLETQDFGGTRNVVFVIDLDCLDYYHLDDDGNVVNEVSSLGVVESDFKAWLSDAGQTAESFLSVWLRPHALNYLWSATYELQYGTMMSHYLSKMVEHEKSNKSFYSSITMHLRGQQQALDVLN